MGENVKGPAKSSFSLDWLVRGVLSKLGDTFDRLTGRNWTPSSNLATSRLTEVLQRLLDGQVIDLGKKGRFVPHIFDLRVQWDRFSVESEKDIIKLEQELHAAAIDHINDCRYHTYSPITISVKPDYFMEGVILVAGFGKFGGDEHPEVEIVVSLSEKAEQQTETAVTQILEPGSQTTPVGSLKIEFTSDGKTQVRELVFGSKKRHSIGRSAENDVVINDRSISKVHAAIAVDSRGRIVLADTGSTNGTFIDGARIAYGKAREILPESELRVGGVELKIGFPSVASPPAVTQPAIKTTPGSPADDPEKAPEPKNGRISTEKRSTVDTATGDEPPAEPASETGSIHRPDDPQQGKDGPAEPAANSGSRIGEMQEEEEWEI